MGTYYGYTNRDQDKSVIDWAGITKTISEDIFKEKNSREARRFELDKTQNEQLRKLDEYTQGIDKSANQAAMEAAQGYRDFLMENHKLMKNGLMSVNDSKLVKSNAKATWATLNTAFKGHQDAYKTKVDAGGEGNLLLAERMSEMFDFQNKKIIPSKNGEAVFVNIDPKTGKIDMDTALPVSGLLNNQQRMWDTIDVQASASKAAAAASIYKYSPSSTRTITDIRENKDFADWKTNTILAALDTPQRQASVLMDYVGVDSDDIKMVEDGQGVLQPELTPEQLQAAKDAYGSALEIGLGYEETKVAPIRETASERSSRSGKKTKEATFNTIIAALQGDQAKYKTIFDPMEQALVTMDPATLQMKISGKDPIAIGKDQSIAQAGARIAAQMGLSAEEFTAFINKKNLTNPNVSEKVSGFDIFDTTVATKYATTDNIEKLNKSLVFSMKNMGDIDKTDLVGRRNSFRRAITAIAINSGSEVIVNDDDTVIVNGVSIPDGVNNPTLVLKTLEGGGGTSKYNKKK
tara:strand:- start:244 stop:1803 length:1560 start_codon:yes stop_codon:yes gene_type:complete